MASALTWFAIVGVLLVSCDRRVEAAPKAPRAPSVCGYDSCPKGDPNKINVHVVPHTHDDVGWLKTIDEYYYGSLTVFQRAGVQYIIDSVIKELKKDPARRFIYVEMAFFTQWWNEQSEDTRNDVRMLVDEGRLEFINGGWCMNDEATTHYNDIIDQMTWGLRFLNDTFGECGRPRVAWQIDPFGHSREQASLFALMGYDGQFFARIDHDDKDQRLRNKEMEMIWQASNTLGERGSLFSGMLYNHYSAPSGFCFDVKCSDAPFIDNRKSPDYNVVEKIASLSAQIRLQNASFTTNHIMFTMGDDFNYMTADMNFKNMDKMIKYANELDMGVNLFYSTPSCYVKALNEAQGVQWPIKTDDFFPYASDNHGYWTGYFTSRPAFKGTVRKTNAFLQSCKQLHSLAHGAEATNQNLIDSLRRSMAEAQHHDAVAGTEKEHVSRDYRLRIHDSTVECQQDVSQSFSKLMTFGVETLPAQQFCLRLNTSECPPTETGTRFVATAYNPRSQEQTLYVRLPVTDGVFTVLDPDGSEMVTQLVPLPVSTARQLDRHEERDSSATHELVFQAAKLPPMGHKSYYIVKTSSKSTGLEEQATTIYRPRDGEAVSITNDRVTVHFGGNGLIESVMAGGVRVPLTQSLMWYAGMRQGNSGSSDVDRPSGAYIFRPNGTDAHPISETATLVVFKGQLVHEVHQVFDADWATQVIRLYKGHDDVEIEWTVGHIPVDDRVPKEIISRVVTELPSAGKFYSDANGRQTLLRQRDFRPTWTLRDTEPVSRNYYPVNSHLYLTDSSADTLIALVNDRSQGGTSLKDGQLELMVHRRCLDDDHKGVGEALNEQGEGGQIGPGLVVRGDHHLVVDPSLNGRHPMAVIRPIAQQTFMKPWLSFAPTDLSFTKWKNSFHTQKSGLTRPLPDNLHVLTMEPWKDGTHLLRLEHVFDAMEDETLSLPITIELDDLLEDYVVIAAEETTLGANQWAADVNRLHWNSEGPGGSTKIQDDRQSPKMSVTLGPIEIKTFIVTVKNRSEHFGWH